MLSSLPDGDAVLARILEGDVEKTAALKDLGALRQREMGMWQDWKDSNEDPTKLRPLLTSYDRLLQKQVNVYRHKVPIPPAAIEAEFKNHMVTAFRTFDPNRGTQLSTHVHNHLKKGKRFITKYQNVGSIPETRSYKITAFKTAKAEVEEKTGTDPTSTQLADQLGWNIREVERMNAEHRKDLPTSGFRSAEGEIYDPTALMPSREMEVIHLMPAELSNDELSVFEHTFGLGGKPQLRPGQIAKKLNMSPSRVSRIRNKLAVKVGEYYHDLD